MGSNQTLLGLNHVNTEQTNTGSVSVFTGRTFLYQPLLLSAGGTCCAGVCLYMMFPVLAYLPSQVPAA